jgi:hypothetical protein
MQMKLLGITNVDFEVIDLRLIIFPISGRYWRKNGSIMVQYISYLYVSRKCMFQLRGKYFTVI